MSYPNCIRRRQAKTATAHIDNGRRSFFRVQGVQAVKELMEALITWKEPRTSDRAHGPPTLISPQCFLNSTLKCAEVRATGLVFETSYE